MHKENGDRVAKTPLTGMKAVIYDSGTIKVVVFACLSIILAVIITGSISYFITRNAVVDKVKTRDLVFTIESITAKIDGRIERAKETSLMLAYDPMIYDWVIGAEQDTRLSKYSKDKINDVAQNYDYANAFVVSAVTNQYWAEGFKSIQVMSRTNPNDTWFFDALKSGKRVDINIDYNSSRHDTFVFINALVGNVNQPVAVAGVGLSLKSIAEEFKKYKFGEKSNLWLIDSKGKIHLSDDFSHNGMYLNDFVPQEVFSQVVNGADNTAGEPKIIEYTNFQGETIDLAYQLTRSSAWKVVFQIPRDESIAVLSSIKLNTAIAGLVALVLMTIVFYVIAYRIANPLKRALLLTAEMEKQVTDRTQELVEKNQKILDSIEYAQRLQEAILPTPQELENIFKDYFILWKPRDIVGGDFYWTRQLDADRCLVAVIDCTGHGVPGAFMSMAANSILKHIVDQGHTDPGCILSELNCRLKEILYRNDHNGVTDDGLDIGVCYIDHNKVLTFAGAKIPLYIYRDNEVNIFKGDKRSIGYRRSNSDLKFTNHQWEVRPGDRFYLTTDGYTDQNGGVKDYPLGRKKLVEVIMDNGEIDLPQQRDTFEHVLSEYMGTELQRDDITILGFSFK